MGLRRDGVISDEVFEKLTAEVDAALLDPQQSLFINDQPAEYKRGD
jgi:hypothetical protein